MGPRGWGRRRPSRRGSGRCNGLPPAHRIVATPQLPGHRPCFQVCPSGRPGNVQRALRTPLAPGGMMRKTLLLSALAAGVLGIVAVAYAANTYTVDIAQVTPTNSGTLASPK